MQLRDKLGTVQKASAFIVRAQRYLKGRIPFIVNDRADLAQVTGAAGVHVGQEDLAVSAARRICGARAIVGKSCQTLAHLVQAQHEGVDYIGFGSIFRTQTKPERLPMDLAMLRAVVQRAKVPVFAIGGITQDNVAVVRSCGVSRAALCREILLARDPGRAAKEMKKILIADRRI